MADQVMSALNGSAAQVRLSGTDPPRRLTMLTGGSTITYRYRYAGVISSTTSLGGIPAGAIRLGAVTS